MKWWRSSSGRLIQESSGAALYENRTKWVECTRLEKIGRNARNNFDSWLPSWRLLSPEKMSENAPRGSRRNGLSFSGICGCVGRNQSTHSRLKRNRFFIHWAQKFFIQWTTRGPFQRLRFFRDEISLELCTTSADEVDTLCHWPCQIVAQSSLTWLHQLAEQIFEWIWIWSKFDSTVG